jgi:hypothetical protein
MLITPPGDEDRYGTGEVHPLQALPPVTHLAIGHAHRVCACVDLGLFYYFALLYGFFLKKKKKAHVNVVFSLCAPTTIHTFWMHKSPSGPDFFFSFWGLFCPRFFLHFRSYSRPPISPVMAWGDGSHGRLGNGSWDSLSGPEDCVVLGRKSVKMVACGRLSGR